MVSDQSLKNNGKHPGFLFLSYAATKIIINGTIRQAFDIQKTEDLSKYPFQNQNSQHVS